MVLEDKTNIPSSLDSDLGNKIEEAPIKSLEESPETGYSGCSVPSSCGTCAYSHECFGGKYHVYGNAM